MYILSSYKLIQDAFLWIFPQKTNPNCANRNHGKHTKLSSRSTITTSGGRHSLSWQCKPIDTVIIQAEFCPLSNAHYRGGSVPPPNTWFLWSTRVHSQNRISIGSSVLAQLTAVTDTHTQTDRHRPRYVCSNRPHLCTQCMWCGLKITITGLLFAGVAR